MNVVLFSMHTFLFKHAIAQIARVRSFTGVLTTMTHKVVRTRAPFAAHIAHVFASIATGVLAIRVHVQNGSRVESLHAFIAIHLM